MLADGNLVLLCPSSASAGAEWLDSGAVREERIMSTTATGLVRDIPLSKLKASAANARRTDTSLGIEELAASIAAHGLLQMPVVTPELDGAGQETGFFHVTAGERRRKALLRLVKDKKLRSPAWCGRMASRGNSAWPRTVSGSPCIRATRSRPLPGSIRSRAWGSRTSPPASGSAPWSFARG
jgi:hypothetical protein